MKKLLYALLLALLVLAACGSDETPTAAEPDEEQEQEPVEDAAAGDGEEEAATDGDVEVLSEIFYFSTDHDDNLIVHYFGEVQNNTGEEITLYDHEVVVKGADDSILAVGGGGSSFPSHISSGNNGYIETRVTVEDGVTEEEVEEVFLQVSYSEAHQPFVALDVENISHSVDDTGRYAVTGAMVNNTENDIDSAQAVAIFYNEANEMIGLVTGYPDGVKVGEERVFELRAIGPIVDSIGENIASVEVIAAEH